MLHPRLALMVSLVACGGPPPEDLEAALTRRGGCADMVVFAVDSDDRWLLTVELDDIVQEAREAGTETWESTLEIPGTNARASLERGVQVSDAICDDVIENGGPRVDQVWRGSSGAIDVLVRRGEGDVYEADVRVRDLTLTEEDGSEEVEVPSMEWTGVTVGWFAG